MRGRFQTSVEEEEEEEEGTGSYRFSIVRADVLRRTVVARR